jgi:hypothetical protein
VDTLLTHARILQLIAYDPETGVLRWRVNRKKVKAGDVAGTLHHSGYWVVTVDGRQYGAHCLIWFYMTGEWAKPTVDHHNRKKADNRWENLRKATFSQNRANTPAHADGALKVKGVCWNKDVGKFQVQIKRRYFGLFNTLEEASAVAAEKAAEAYGEFA